MNRISLKKEIQDQLEQHMQDGYQKLISGTSSEACEIWNEFWNKLIEVMKENQFKFIEDLDADFQGTQSIFNWASDFELELTNAGLKNPRYLEKRIDFCQKYIEVSKGKTDLNTFNMRRAIAESYFQLGRKAEGEQLFEKDLEQWPKWGWGWIGWSDMYWLFALEQNKDKEKAMRILEQALKVDGLEDRLDVLERLRDLYSEFQMEVEAEDITAKMAEFQPHKSERGSFIEVIHAPTAGRKIGRNDSCPCGSGEKYKKCCGA